MPCLTVHDRALVESNLINEFLDEWVPQPPLMPDDPADHHEVRRLCKYVDDVCLPAVQKPNWSRSMQPVAEKWSDEELELRLAAFPSEGRRALWRRMARDPFTREEIDAGLDVLEDLTRRIKTYLQASGGAMAVRRAPDPRRYHRRSLRGALRGGASRAHAAGNPRMVVAIHFASRVAGR